MPRTRANGIEIQWERFGEADAPPLLPALVIHGDADPLVPVECGRDTHAAIPGAEWLEIPGMGHELPPAVWDLGIEAIATLAERAEAAPPMGATG